jgi:selenocysteine lyase/cysteine desulfurase
MAFFHKASTPQTRHPDFTFVPEETAYFDTACQSLRPEPVLTAADEYHKNYNACGGRVQYGWGKRVDREIEEAKQELLAFVGKNSKEYAVAFTLNTTYGINLVLHQLKEKQYGSIITSDIEHNSVFLPSIIWSQKRNVPRTIISRSDDGSLPCENIDFENAVVLLNTMSNIDGRTLKNLPNVSQKVQEGKGLLLLDAAQHLAHNPTIFRDIPFDALFGSSHKMYGQSLGVIVIKKTLLADLDPWFLGGGTVDTVHDDNITLHRKEDQASILEPGLQHWAGIIGLKAALSWIQNVRFDGKTGEEHERNLAKTLFEKLKELPRIQLMNTEPSAVTSFSIEGIDAHKVAILLGERNIFCRSGHFCCHHYLEHVLKLPPLLRVSLGLHSTEHDIHRLIDSLQIISTTL